VDEAVRRVVQSQRFVMGDEVTALEEEIAAYTGAHRAMACASGSDAVWLALWARGIGPGHAMLCHTYTWLRPRVRSPARALSRSSSISTRKPTTSAWIQRTAWRRGPGTAR